MNVQPLGHLQYYNFRKEQEEIHPEPLLSGEDLIAMGYTPGPPFHDILQELEEAQLEGQINSKEEAAEWVRKRHPLG